MHQTGDAHDGRSVIDSSQEQPSGSDRDSLLRIEIYGPADVNTSRPQHEPPAPPDRRQVPPRPQLVKPAPEGEDEPGPELSAREEAVSTQQEDIATQDKAYREKRRELGELIAQQHMDAPLGPTVSLMGSKNPTEFLDGLGAVQALNSSQAEQLEEFSKLSMPSPMTVSEQAKSSFEFARPWKDLHGDVHFAAARAKRTSNAR